MISEKTVLDLEGRCSIQLSYGRTMFTISDLQVVWNPEKIALYPCFVSHMICAMKTQPKTAVAPTPKSGKGRAP